MAQMTNRKKIEKFFDECPDFRHVRFGMFHGVLFCICMAPTGKQCRVIVSDHNRGHFEINRTFAERTIEAEIGLIVIVDSASNKYRYYDLKDLYQKKQLFWLEKYCNIPNKAFTTMSEIRKTASMMSKQQAEAQQTRMEI